jgi:hypothetical protein
MQTMPYETPFHPMTKTPEPCTQFPDLVRMNYFYGQMLGPRDFLAEQAYHRAKHLLINRCLHGYGVVCGLWLSLVAGEEPCPDPKGDQRRALEAKIAALEAEIAKIEAANKDDPRLPKLEAELEELWRKRDELTKTEGCEEKEQHGKEKNKVKLSCGFAIDPTGHEILVGHDIVFDLGKYLSEADWEKITAESGGLLYISICYAECGFEPVRPAAMDACQIVPGCQDARIRESYRLAVTLEAPDADERCEVCCSGTCETCLLLATVRVRPGESIKPEDVDNSVRRPFGLYAPTVITGINWHHGSTYSPDDAETLLGTGADAGGLEIRFSRPIHVSTIKPGVVELLSFAGGRGVAGEITHITGKFIDLPQTGMVDRILYRDTTDERPRPGDRIMVIVRCDFLLDACCRPVDGNHVGGRVPYVGTGAHKEKQDKQERQEKHERHPKDEPAKDPCITMPGRGGAWTSGNGVPGGSFETWFFIERDKESVA